MKVFFFLIIFAFNFPIHGLGNDVSSGFGSVSDTSSRDTISYEFNDYEFYNVMEDFFLAINWKDFERDTFYCVVNEHDLKVKDSIIVSSNDKSEISVYKSTIYNKTYFYTFETLDPTEISRILKYVQPKILDLDSYNDKNQIFRFTIISEGYIFVITKNNTGIEPTFHFLIFNSFI